MLAYKSVSAGRRLAWSIVPDLYMLINRIGTFFILLGLFLIGMYILSDMVKQAACGLLILGGALVGLGIILWFRDPLPPPPPANRFRLLKSLSQKQEKKK